MITRRTLTYCGAACLLRHGIAHSQPSSDSAVLSKTYGCHLPLRAAASYVGKAEGAKLILTGHEDLVSHSASIMFDYAFAQTLARLCQAFQVRPGFSYYREPSEDPQNAYATEQRIISESDGTVLFGLNMLGALLARSQNGPVSVIAVAAHEFGHIVALKRGFQSQLAPDATHPFRSEQFADYMSGYFSGIRRRNNPNFPASDFAMTFRDMAGTSQGTHGTREERGEAIARGT